LSAEQRRQRYLLSMLLRYPRIIPAYADTLGGLRPEDERLGAAWDLVLARRGAQSFDELAAGLDGDGPVTRGYLEALARDSAVLPPQDERRLRAALDDAIALLRADRLRQRIARCQARLREAGEQERPTLLAELAALTREKAELEK
jgi:hypothetical protein